MRTFSFRTKTNSRRSSPSGKRYTAILALALCGFLALAYWHEGAGTAASMVFTPIISARTWFMESSGRLPSYLRSQHALLGDIRSLEEALEKRGGDAFTIKQLQSENEALRELRGLKIESRIIAGVLVRPNQTPYDTFLIDRGTADGIVDGAIVYTGEHIATGVIMQVYPHSALVRLVSASGMRSTAYIFGPNIFTEAEGIGGGVLKVTVPQGIPLAVGDVVVLPGAGAGAYGEVVYVESLPSNPEQYGYVTSPVPMQSVRYVSVAKSAAPTISYETALEAIKSATSTPFSFTVPAEVLIGTTTATTSATTTE